MRSGFAVTCSGQALRRLKNAAVRDDAVETTHAVASPTAILSGGTTANSPALQRRVGHIDEPSSVGTTDTRAGSCVPAGLQPSLRDYKRMSNLNPALKCRAIGTRRSAAALQG